MPVGKNLRKDTACPVLRKQNKKEPCVVVVQFLQGLEDCINYQQEVSLSTT